ncbi:hypothetical protein HMPREF0083_05470 [Aneurinibacillus aneurinilyticus ATCC 12856]|uniref:Uncharacterized protein n=1 Tax=Aneurinibacillus aneurinilyticus ATCC 12856 TaxID=649747 RepID=U1WUI4_ANEAE|nr:hypothetical protein HMPREF0083_05470 [Aneurinibacillus aneurinilyticus ATCC 12856]
MSFSAHFRPSFFSYLSPQTCVDLSNHMYIVWKEAGFSIQELLL